MQECYSLLSASRHDALSSRLLGALVTFREREHAGINNRIRDELNEFMQDFFHLFCNPDFAIPPKDAPKFISLNSTIAYLAGCSVVINTDSWLRTLCEQNAPVEKILALYSLRNRFRLPLQELFREKPGLASHWYAMQTFTALPPAQPWLMENARAHYRDMPDAYQVVSPGTVSAGYFDITYLEPEDERSYKQKLNRAIRRDCEMLQWSGQRNPRSLAVITRRWFPGSAVYRALRPYLETLVGDYRLTLVHLGKMNPAIDTSMFSSIRTFPRLQNVRQLNAEQRAAVLDQDWTVAYFPDVGMDVESIYLGNCRLAPVQVMGYGHPASMHGGQIDYFMAGEDSEIPELADRYFSERLVLLPGMGMIPVWPTAPVEKQSTPDAGRVLINCPWTLMKMNADLIGLLKEITDACSKPVCFRFFTDLDKADQWARPVYWQDIAEILGEDNFELHGMMGYRKFLAEMAKGDISIVPYPFGGFNTVIDSLYVGVPAVVREGTHGYNRFPCALLRKAGLGEVVTHGHSEFRKKILALIEDKVFRESLAEQIGRSDLKRDITANLDPAAFRRAINHLVANHETLKPGQPGAPIHIE